MARCGCNTACACAIQAGDNVEVLGTGSAANPYVISAEATALDVLDTETVDLHRTGAGTEDDPYIISADVRISDDVDNCLTQNADGLKVPCPQNALEGDGSTTSVEGTGTDADPYIVHAISTAVPAPGCGIVVDGSEISVNTGEPAWPFACGEIEGGDIYCDPVTGRVHVDPEKFALADAIQLNSLIGVAQFNTISAADSVWRNVGPVGNVPIVNPSQCRDMLVRLDYGVAHGRINYTGAGDGEITLGARLDITGSVVMSIAAPSGPHQSSNFDRSSGVDVLVEDFMNSTSVIMLTIPAGGAVNVQFQGAASTVSDVGDNSISNWNTRLTYVALSQ